MSKIINLRTRSKQATRQEERRKGNENAASHGMTKAERLITQARADKDRRDLDGHRLEDTERD